MSRETVSRRRFLVRLTGLGAGLISLMLSVPALGFLLSPLFASRRESWVTVGPVDDLPIDLPVARTVYVPLDTGFQVPPVPRVVYLVRRHDGNLRVLSNTCTHMQCNVHYEQRLGQFLCPCHGGLYDLDGINRGGPPPQPLAQWVHRFTTDASGRRILEIANRLEESI